ncbi:MAG: sulfotransferase [Candidatus Electrothrix sp. GW3-4]|uniref:sulfotransferase family protein n=1 Tax=Candidatus Electrothrix sp. GW3-4 TaxID=3126740 RepID=UPI0030CF6DBC
MNKFYEIHAQLSACLQERNQIFPQRDEENDRKVQEGLDSFVDYIDQSLEKKFVIDPQLISKVRAVRQQPVFLCGAMKSGTTLLLELLDGHPELITLPGDSFFIGRIQKEKPPSHENLNEAWRGWVKRMVNPTGQAPFWIFGEQVEPYVYFYQALQHWYDQMPDTWRSSVLSVVLAYFCANPSRPLSPKLWVEKTPGNEFKVKEILDDFPSARFIHIVRDPRENLASLKRLYATRNWSWQPAGIADMLARSCRAAAMNQKELGHERYHVLRYEDLTDDPAGHMKRIGGFLGVGWHETMLGPTVNGLSAHANSMYKERQVTGAVRKSPQNKWRTVLTGPEQRMALNTRNSTGELGYSWEITTKDTLLLPLDMIWDKIKRTLRLAG